MHYLFQMKLIKYLNLISLLFGFFQQSYGFLGVAFGGLLVVEVIFTVSVGAGYHVHPRLLAFWADAKSFRADVHEGDDSTVKRTIYNCHTHPPCEPSRQLQRQIVCFTATTPTVSKDVENN